MRSDRMGAIDGTSPTFVSLPARSAAAARPGGSCHPCHARLAAAFPFTRSGERPVYVRHPWRYRYLPDDAPQRGHLRHVTQIPLALLRRR
jgi:hypothetical protein